MGRKKAAQHCDILPWLSAKADCREGRFCQVGNSLMFSPAFHELTAGARYLYLCMCMESGGRRDFRFPLTSAKKYGISSSSFRRQVDELVKAHFVQIVEKGRNTRTPNGYSFVFEWKQGTEKK